MAEGKFLKKQIFDKWTPPEYFFHLGVGGHLAAIRLHQKNPLFFKIDLADFFGSINLTRVTRLLKTLFPYEEARRLAKLSTVNKETKARSYLPFGFVQSPAIASFALHQSALGASLADIAQNPALTLSVYVDDIIVSGKCINTLTDAYGKLLIAVERSNFELNPQKTHPPKNELIAFNLKMADGKISLLERRLAEFTQLMQTTEKPMVRKGVLSYVNKVNPAQCEILKANTGESLADPVDV
jgi:hypothetical protein